MKDKAIELIKNYENKTNVFYLHTIDLTDVINMMLEFGHYVAEEQKVQCASEAQTIHLGNNFVVVDDLTILNSKNVCQEQ
jgi:hypothetical protein